MQRYGKVNVRFFVLITAGIGAKQNQFGQFIAAKLPQKRLVFFCYLLKNRVHDGMKLKSFNTTNKNNDPATIGFAPVRKQNGFLF